MSAFRIAMLNVHQLKAHELTDFERTEEIINELKDNPVLRHPIIVDAKSRVILDGHHRHEAFFELGFRKIPCLLVDYFSEDIQVEPRRADIPVSKEEVIRRGRNGKLFPTKTTKHTIVAELSNVECSLPLNLRGRLCWGAS